MFFYEGFGTMGIPTPLIDWVANNFPGSDEAGIAFTNTGHEYGCDLSVGNRYDLLAFLKSI